MSLWVTPYEIWCPECQSYSQLNIWRDYYAAGYRFDYINAGCSQMHVLATLTDIEAMDHAIAGTKADRLIHYMLKKIPQRPLTADLAFWHASAGVEWK